MIIIINIQGSVSRVTVVLSIVSLVSQLFSFLVGCKGMILKGFGFAAFLVDVKDSSSCDTRTKRQVSFDTGTTLFKTFCMRYFNCNGGRMTVINKAALSIVSVLQPY